MENKIIATCLKRAVLIFVIAFLLGVSFGIIMEKIIPSNFQFTILSEKQIFQNNIATLLNSWKYGFLSFGLYSIDFGGLYGKTVGQGAEILFRNYGMNGIVSGFLPHAIFETICCLCAVILPIFGWNIVLNIFLKKNKISKWKVIPKILGIMVALVLLVILLCVVAAHIEYNVSEMHWMSK